jgi:hypothetical protein
MTTTAPDTTPAAAPAAELATILKLDGDGYTLSVTKETVAAKTDLITAAAAVTQVTNNDESTVAQFQIRHLASFRNAVEKSRTEVKAPVLELGKKIDAAAKEFVEQIVAEENRLKKLVGNHAEEVAAAKRAAEAEERRKFEEARRAKEEAERAEAAALRAKEAAANAVSIQDAIKAKQAAREAEAAAARAEEERQAAMRERMASSAVVATTRDAGGVKFEPDFEVIDARAFLSARPDLCDIVVKRRETLAWLKEKRAEGVEIGALGDAYGLKVTLKPVVSTR